LAGAARSLIMKCSGFAKLASDYPGQGLPFASQS
jgi:hypothetical protein